MKIIINNISIDKDTVKEVKQDLLPELLLEMGFVKGLDLDKPMTSVYVISHKDDNETEFEKMFNKKH